MAKAKSAKSVKTAKAMSPAAKGGGRAKLVKVMKAEARDAARKRLKVLEALIARRIGTIVESFYDIGEALREILDHKLYGAAKHESFEAFLEARKLIAPRQAEKLVAIVRHVPRDVAIAQGQEKAYALVALTAATPEPDTVASVVADGEVAGIAVADASVRELTAKTRRLNAARRAETPAGKAHAKADAKLEKGLRKVLKRAGLAVASVRVEAKGVFIEATRKAAEKCVE